MNTWLKSSVLMCLMLALMACGFHLRGQYQLPAPMSRLYLQTTDPYAPFVQRLRQALLRMDVTLTPNAKDANVVLAIDAMNHGQSLVSSSTTSQVNTYALSFTVRYTLQSPTGKILLGPQSISASQNATISSDQAISSASQQQQLDVQLYEEVIAQLFNQLSSKKALQALHTSPNA